MKYERLLENRACFFSCEFVDRFFIVRMRTTMKLIDQAYSALCECKFLCIDDCGLVDR